MKKRKIIPHKTKIEKIKEKIQKPQVKDTEQRISNQKEYDSTWSKFSKAYRTTHPFCRECLKDGIFNDEHIQVDHIIPLVQRPDLKYDTNNLQSLCRSHHSTKTYLETLAKKKPSE